MSYRLRFSAKEEYTLKYKNTIYFKDKKSNGYMDTLEFEDGLSLVKSDIQFQEDYGIKIDGDSKNMIFTFLLDGITKYQPSTHSFNIDAKKDHTTVVIDNYSNGVKKYNRNTHLKSVQLFLKEDYFKNLLNDEYFEHSLVKKFNQNNDFLECIKLNKTDASTKINISEIFQTPFDGSFNKLYIQSKALDILQHELKNILKPQLKNNKDLKFSEYDRQALYKAKDILIANMANPPSLISLSKMVKLNEFKLKIGFKKIFNNTAYGLLFEHKMIRAKQLLKDSEYDINEIANLIGYKYPCNFTTAFTKRFGVSPKELMKRRNYYY